MADPTASQVGPCMTVNEIVATLKDIVSDASISKEDINQPKADKIQKIYYSILMDVGFSNDFLTVQVQFQELQENQDIFTKPFEIMKLLGACQYFLKRIDSCQHMSLSDLINPNFKSTKRILTIMLNFWVFCNGIYEETMEVKEEIERIKCVKQNIKEDTEKIKEEIDSLRKNSAEDLVRENQILKKIDDLSLNIEHYQKESAALKDELNTEKARLDEDNEELLKYQRDVRKLLDQENALNGLLKKDIDNGVSEKELAELREARDDAQQNFRELELGFELSHKKGCDFNALFGQLEVLFESVKNIKATENVYRCSERQSECLIKEIEAIEANILSNKQVIKEISQKKAQINSKWIRGKEVKENELREYQEKLEDKRQGADQDSIAASDLNESIRTLGKKISDLEEEIKTFNQECEKEYYEVLKSVKIASDKINEDIKKINQYVENLLN